MSANRNAVRVSRAKQARAIEHQVRRGARGPVQADHGRGTATKLITTDVVAGFVLAAILSAIVEWWQERKQ